MSTFTSAPKDQNLHTPPSSTRLLDGAIVRRLARRKNNNDPKIVTVTPHTTTNSADENETVTPRKLLPTMDRYRAQSIELVHVGKYLVSLQPENCSGLASLFDDLTAPAAENEENAENNPRGLSFPSHSYETPPRANHHKHLLSPPIEMNPKKRRVLKVAAPPGFYKGIPSLEGKTGNDDEEELFRPILKPRNLNLEFGSLVNDTTLA